MSFPLPPEIYFSKYTAAAVLDGTAPPPPPIPTGPYSCFGCVISESDPLLRSLEEQNFPRLYAEGEPDNAAEFKKLNKELLQAYLELLDLITTEGKDAERSEKLEHMNRLYINMMHLLNEFRPHQARETMKAMLELQKKQRDDLALELDKQLKSSEDILRECMRVLKENKEKAAEAPPSLPVEFSAEIERTFSSSTHALSTPLRRQSLSSTPSSGHFATYGSSWQMDDETLTELLLDNALAASM